jgi:hypothetical protein
MTTITFERSGGVIGNETHFDVDLNTLPGEEADRVLKLIDEANFFNLPTDLTGKNSPDEFQYRITIDNGGDTHTVRVTDTTMPESMGLLVKELTMMKILRR